MEEPLLEVKDLSKNYARGSLFGPKLVVTALDSVSFSLKHGSSIAFVGESGSGKSTLGMCVCRLVEPDTGEVRLHGQDLLSLSGSALRRLRSKIQMIFQDSATAFNPSFSAVQVVCEPIAVQSSMGRTEQIQRALKLMERVGLAADSAHRTTMQFSGGQRQRLAIARALAADAEIIILDEALSGLDMAVQAGIVELLQAVQEERGLSYIHITHDLELAGCLADNIAVMNAGRIVETGSPDKVLRQPAHPHTQALAEAMLSMERRR